MKGEEITTTLNKSRGGMRIALNLQNKEFNAFFFPGVHKLLGAGVRRSGDPEDIVPKQ